METCKEEEIQLRSSASSQYRPCLEVVLGLGVLELDVQAVLGGGSLITGTRIDIKS
jgi:hypothetical protein